MYIIETHHILDIPNRKIWHATWLILWHKNFLKIQQKCAIFPAFFQTCLFGGKYIYKQIQDVMCYQRLDSENWHIEQAFWKVSSPLSQLLSIYGLVCEPRTKNSSFFWYTRYLKWATVGKSEKFKEILATLQNSQ